MRTTSSPPPATGRQERRRQRLEKLLQITAHAYDLRLELGEHDAFGQNRIVLGVGKAESDSARPEPTKGRGLHLLGHYLAASPDSIARVEGAQAEGRPGFVELWHALEDARLENRMVERWPGMDRAFAEALPAQHGARRWDRLPPARQVDWGIYLAGRGISPGVFSIAVQDALDASADEIRRGAGGRTPEDSLQATHAIYPRVRHLLRGETGPGGHRRAQEPTSEHERGDPPRRHEVPEIALPGLVLAGDHPRRRSLPEWYRPGSLPWFEVGLGDKEVHPSARRSDHQTIVPPPAGDAETYHSLWREVQAEVGSALSRFLRVHRESTYLRFAGRYRSGRLGQNKLWRQRLADYRLFARREGGGRRRMAAVLLVDESASMQSEDKIRTATKAAILAGECLHRLDIPFEIIGFTTASFEAREAMRLGLTPARDYRTLRCSLSSTASTNRWPTRTGGCVRA